jgi:hypothetical protein
MNFFKGMNLGTGIAIGVGAGLLAPIVIPAVTGAIRPLAKGILKGGMVMVEKGKVMCAEARETVEDLAAEARDELSRKDQPVPAVSAAEGSGAHDA